MIILSNTRSVASTGTVGLGVPQTTRSFQGLINLPDDFNQRVQGTAAADGSTAAADAQQISTLRSDKITMMGGLSAQTSGAGQSTRNSLAQSVFEVVFSIAADTNFALTGSFSGTSHDHTAEQRDFSITASNGTIIATLNDLIAGKNFTPLPAGVYRVEFNTAVGARTDPLGDNGAYSYMMSLIGS